MLDREFPGRGEPLVGLDRPGQGVDDSVVESDERRVGLRDREVLVVAEVRDDRLAFGLVRRAGSPWEIESVQYRVAAGGDGLADVQPALAGSVELL